jgi:hypothetical protein
VNIWQSTLSRTVVALIEMMSSKFICLFWLRYEAYACGGLLNLLIVTPHVTETLIKVINKELGANTILNLQLEFKNKV